MISRKERCFVVILFGTLEYDGRVLRIIEILQRMGRVVVIDTSSVESSESSVDHKRVILPKNVGFISRHLRFWLAAIRQVIRLRPDAVIAEDFFAALPGWAAGKLVNARVVYDAHELIIPDRRWPTGKRSHFWYMLERWVVPRSDLVIAANVERARLMAEHYNLSEAPEFMRNIPPVKEACLTTEEALAKYPVLNRQSEQDRIVLYQGDISLARGLSRFIEALKYLPKNCRLILVGDGPDLDALKQLGETFFREGRFTALGRVPNHLLSSITRLADVGIVTYPFEGLNNIYCAPNKIFEYAQAGLPVIATNQPTIHALVNHYQIGELISRQEGPSELAEAIQKIVYNLPTYRSRLPGFVLQHQWEDEAERVHHRILALFD
ncbi:glycosyltransferase [Marinobacter adhaerens]|uniref:Glycosyltransferase n=1 Tax=Marinobacter adhaerens TaxID=1033846 RepID=A0A851HQS4_9GAMM|nr:glycosyltransferase [Marinobacter adhaerens]NWN91784.1 glycosyltransferase [Marinobacter adhaerens]